MEGSLVLVGILEEARAALEAMAATKKCEDTHFFTYILFEFLFYNYFSLPNIKVAISVNECVVRIYVQALDKITTWLAPSLISRLQHQIIEQRLDYSSK